MLIPKKYAFLVAVASFLLLNGIATASIDSKQQERGLGNAIVGMGIVSVMSFIQSLKMVSSAK